MKKKIVTVLLSTSLASFFTAAFADDTTYQPEQSSTNQNDPYNEAEKNEQKNHKQNKIYKDKQSGYEYVIPWNENSEYYGNPPPKMPEAPPEL